jgi:hypothetical protein
MQKGIPKDPAKKRDKPPLSPRIPRERVCLHISSILSNFKQGTHDLSQKTKFCRLKSANKKASVSRDAFSVKNYFL